MNETTINLETHSVLFLTRAEANTLYATLVATARESHGTKLGADATALAILLKQEATINAAARNAGTQLTLVTRTKKQAVDMPIDADDKAVDEARADDHHESLVP